MGHAIEVLKVFTKLGTTSFGGPIAHLAYFRSELVEKRQWLTEEQYASLLALCQFLPGPASSQLGFCLGYIRAGWLGAFAAFTAFTLPSVCLLICFALLTPHLGGEYGQAAIHGLKIVALVVVGHGVMGMAKKLCADRLTATIAAAAAGLVVLFPGAWMQVLVVLAAALITGLSGRALSERPIHIPTTHSARLGSLLILIALALLLGIPLVSYLLGSEQLAFIDAFYRSGALVFGGGHVVLPLLEETVVGPGWVSPQQFLAGYGATQAMPGPMFSFAGYLGFVSTGPMTGLLGALVASLALFAPGFLLVAGILPHWSKLAAQPLASRGLIGASAAVVGILGAALYDPIWTSAIIQPIDLVIALGGFVLLTSWKCSALIVVLFCVTARCAMASFGY